MKRVIGLGIFFIGVGIFISFLIPGKVGDIIVGILCMLIGYNLFCSCDCK